MLLNTDQPFGSTKPALTPSTAEEGSSQKPVALPSNAFASFRPKKQAKRPGGVAKDEAEASVPRETEEAAAPPQERFWKDYRITLKDIGFTPLEIHARIELGDEPDVYDEEILDAVLFRGCYRKTFSFGDKGSFTLATCSPQAQRDAYRIIREEAESNPAAAPTIMNAMVVARHLEELMGRRLCAFSAGEEGFDTEEALRKRYKKVMAMPLSLVEAIGDRVNAFVNRTEAALTRNLSNF